MSSISGVNVDGNFVDGMFGGMKAMTDLAAGWQNYKLRGYQIDAAESVRKAQEDQTNAAGSDGQPRVMPSAAPTAPATPDTTTSDGPVADPDLVKPRQARASGASRTARTKDDTFAPWPAAPAAAPGALSTAPQPQPQPQPQPWTLDWNTGLRRMTPGEPGLGWTNEGGIRRYAGAGTDPNATPQPGAPTGAAPPSAPAPQRGSVQATPAQTGRASDMPSPAQPGTPDQISAPQPRYIPQPQPGDFSNPSARTYAANPPPNSVVVPYQALGQDPNQVALPATQPTPPVPQPVQRFYTPGQDPNQTPMPGASAQQGPNPAGMSGQIVPPQAPPVVNGGPNGTMGPGGGVPFPGQPVPGGPGNQASLGNRILSAINPVSSAQAAPMPAAPAPTPVVQPPPGSVTPSAMAHTLPPPAPLPSGRGGAQATPQASAMAGASPPGPVSAVREQVAPSGQQGPAQQSEPPVSYVRPPFNDKPYTALAEQSPAHRSLVDRIAAEEGVDPSRLALHWNLESALHAKAADGRDGERGVMQVLPSTQKLVDPSMKLDPAVLEDSLRMGARVIHRLDAQYGQNTPSSVVAYQGGPGTADAFAADPERARQEHPNGARYLSNAYGDTRLGRENFPPGIQLDPIALIRAGQEGPDGFLKELASTGPAGIPMSDRWHAAETSLMVLAASRGDMEGVQHARDFVYQMSHQGSITSMMNAYKSLSVGDGAGAAQQLARAHAFFPDGSMGQFGVDKSGKVWAQRVDEHDPNHVLGKPFQVTMEGVQQMLITTQDPNKYAEMLTKMQKENAGIRKERALADYYETQPKIQAAALRSNTQLETARIHTESAERIAAARNQTALDSNTRQDAIHKEIGAGDTGLYASIADPAKRGAAADLHAELRYNNPHMTPDSAADIAKGTLDGRYALGKTTDGRDTIIDRANRTPMAIINPQLAAKIARLLSPAQPNLPMAPRASMGGSAVPASQMVH